MRRSLVLPIAALLLAPACGNADTDPVASTAPSPTTTATTSQTSPTPTPATVPTTRATPTSEAAGTTEVTVTITDFDFAPDPVEVAVGGSITWTNEDSTAHTASVSGGGADTGAIRGGDSATLTFDQPGTFDYVCQFHPGSMTGTIVVG